MWTVYIVECVSGIYYTGITKNLHRRIAQHNSGNGSKLVWGAGGVKYLVWNSVYENRSIASKVECFIKKRSRLEKSELGKLNKYIVIDALGGIRLEDV